MLVSKTRTEKEAPPTYFDIFPAVQMRQVIMLVQYALILKKRRGSMDKSKDGTAHDMARTIAVVALDARSGDNAPAAWSVWCGRRYRQLRAYLVEGPSEYRHWERS